MIPPETNETISSEGHALILESDPCYVQEVSQLIQGVKHGKITPRKFALARNVAAKRSFDRCGRSREYPSWAGIRTA